MKFLKYSTAVTMVVMLTVTAALAAGLLYLPAVQVYVAHGPWLFGTYSTLDITLSGVPEGFDVRNGTYIGWCLEDNGKDNAPAGSLTTLMDSTDPSDFVNDCENYADIPWDRVNYLLNNKFGTPPDPSTWFPGDIQLALWKVAGTDYRPRAMTANAQIMVDDAIANGNGFVPRPGQIVAIALCADGLGEGYHELALDDIQDTIIEVQRGAEDGCTPGYWKQTQHFDSWIPTGYAPGDNFDTVFGVSSSYPDDTLLDALCRGGGHEIALMRHAVAALLNASHPETHYYYADWEVIAMVQSAYNGDEAFNDVRDLLEWPNETGCPLN